MQDKGLMNPDGQMKLSDSVKLVGLCNDMCPEFESVERIVQKMVDKCEKVRRALNIIDAPH